MNSVLLVGRITMDPETKSLENENIRTVFNIAVARNYKNQDGEYDADFIRVVLWGNVANNAYMYCHKGDLVGIKGKLQSRTYQENEKEKRYVLEVIADKVTFLSTASSKKA